jgi:MFS family permease
VVARPLPSPSSHPVRGAAFLGIDRGGWLIFAAQALSGLGTAPFTVFGAIYQRQLGASAFEIGLIAAAGMAVSTLCMLPGTRLAEGYQLRPTILLGWLIAIPGPLAYALAPGWGVTAVGTVLLAASVINTPALNVYLSLGVPRDRIAMVMTVVLSSYSLGLIVATPLTGWLAEAIGIRALFWLSLLTFVLAAVFVVSLPRRELPEDSLAGTGYGELFKARDYMTLLTLFSALTMIIFMPWPFLPLYAKQVMHAGDFAIGGLMAALYLGSVLCGLLLGRLRMAIGCLWVVVSFELLYVASAVGLLAAASVPVLALAFFLRGAFWSFRQVMTAVIGEALPNRALPKGYGLFALVSGATAALAYPLGGWLFAAGPARPILVGAVMMLLALPVTFALHRAFKPKPRLVEAAAAPDAEDWPLAA